MGQCLPESPCPPASKVTQNKQRQTHSGQTSRWRVGEEAWENSLVNQGAAGAQDRLRARSEVQREEIRVSQKDPQPGEEPGRDPSCPLLPLTCVSQEEDTQQGGHLNQSWGKEHVWGAVQSPWGRAQLRVWQAELAGVQGLRPWHMRGLTRGKRQIHCHLPGTGHGSRPSCILERVNEDSGKQRQEDHKLIA